MDFYTRALQINQQGWFVVNCFQVSDIWRVNLQRRTERGSTTEYFSEYAEGDDPVEALEAAYANAKARYPDVDKPGTTRGVTRTAKTALSTAMEKRLEKALGELYFAIRMDRS